MSYIIVYINLLFTSNASDWFLAEIKEGLAIIAVVYLNFIPLGNGANHAGSNVLLLKQSLDLRGV